MILNYKTIKVKNISFLKPKKIYDNYFIIPLYYNEKQIIIQTPKLLVPHGITKYKETDKKYINFIFPEIFNKTYNYFLVFLKNIDSFLKNTNLKILRNKIYNPIIRYTGYKSSFSVRMDKSADIYDELNNKLENYNHLDGKNFKGICCFSYVWVRNNNYGLAKLCLQLKIYKNIDKKCLIIDDENKTIDITKEQKCLSCPHCNNKIQINIIVPNILPETSFEIENIYNKFIKMHSIGVPKQAIYHKIRMEQLDISKFDKLLIMSKKNKIQKMNTLSRKKINPPSLKFNFKDLLSQKKTLRKTSIKKKIQKKTTLDKIRRQSVSGYKVPSLEDIINTLKSLKSVKKNKF